MRSWGKVSVGEWSKGNTSLCVKSPFSGGQWKRELNQISTIVIMINTMCVVLQVFNKINFILFYYKIFHFLNRLISDMFFEVMSSYSFLLQLLHVTSSIISTSPSHDENYSCTGTGIVAILKNDLLRKKK